MVKMPSEVEWSLTNDGAEVNQVTVENTATGESIVLDEAISEGAVVLFDGPNRIVTVNGSRILNSRFNGTIPRVIAGENTIVVTPDQFNISMTADVRVL
jgi:hypothetical protein